MAKAKATKKSKKGTAKRVLKKMVSTVRPEILRLSSRDLWDVLSALRGPDGAGVDDDDDENRGPDHGVLAAVKAYVTTRVRHAVLDVPRYADFPADYARNNLTERWLDELEAELQKLTRRHKHFLRHLELAVLTTSSHPIWGGLGMRVASALNKAHERVFASTGTAVPSNPVVQTAAPTLPTRITGTAV